MGGKKHKEQNEKNNNKNNKKNNKKMCQQLSWIEHKFPKLGVGGSIPFWHTKTIIKEMPASLLNKEAGIFEICYGAKGLE